MTRIRKGICLKPEQAQWVKENCKNLSALVQKKLDEDIKRNNKKEEVIPCSSPSS